MVFWPEVVEVPVRGVTVLLGVTVPLEEPLFPDGIERTLPEESPEVFPEVTFPEVRLASMVRSLVVTVRADPILPVFPETLPVEPLESRYSVVLDWAGLSRVRAPAEALPEVPARLVPGAAAVRVPRTMFSGSPALKPLLTLEDTLLTMAVSTRAREKSLAFTTVMPRVLLTIVVLLFITTVLLFTTVPGLLP